MGSGIETPTRILRRIEVAKPRWRPNRAAPPAAHTFTILRRQPRIIFCVGDLHLPYVDEWRLGRVLQAIKDIKPDVIEQGGDLYDMQAWSRYETDELGMSVQDEWDAGEAMARTFWESVHRAAPRAEKHQLLGNHDSRLLKYAMRNGRALLPAVKDARDRWLFPEFGVQTAQDDRVITEIDGIAFQHGHRMKLGDHATANLQSTVSHHTHRGGVFYRRFRGQVSIWELNAGYLADDNSPAMAYTPTNRAQSVPGFGVVHKAGPVFYPL